VRAGKCARSVASNFSVAQIREAADAAKGGAHFVSVQKRVQSLSIAPENDGVLPNAKRVGCIFSYFPLASGLLTGKYRAEEKLPEGSRCRPRGGTKSVYEKTWQLWSG